MPNEQFEQIQRIRNEFHRASERIRDSLNNTIQNLAGELYSRNPHFIFELIQNAEDNSYKNPSPSLSFRLTRTDPTDTGESEGALIIENNETGFTYDDVDEICKAGESKKEKAQGYIGEKGIGFKSVFLVTTNPHIFSNGYHFCLPERDEETGFGYIVPKWVAPPEGLDPTQTHIILPLTKADFGYDKIEEMLLDIEPETFLFLSKLKEIHIKTDSGTNLKISKNDAAMPEVELLVEGEKQHRSFSRVDRFLVCTETVNKPADIHHEKRKRIEMREISIAFPLDEDSASAGKIFAYLPVRSDTGFPFLINADFILPSSREDILKEEPWNHWLMDCVANLVASMLLPALKERKLLTADFLEKLASRLNDFGTVYGVDRDSLFNPIFTRVREAFMNKELLPANDGTFVSVLNAKLARGDAIRNLLEHKQLGDLFGSNNEIKWLSDEITQDRTPELRSFLMKLDLEEVRPRLFFSKLSKQFLEQQSDEWFIRFYRFLSTHFGELRSDLSTQPILRLQNETHVYPPNAYLPIGIDTDSSFPIVKVELAQDEDVRDFLRELGVREREIVDDVIEHILPKYECDARTIPVAEHRTDFEKIKRAYNTDSQANRTRLRERLLETPFILAESTHAGRPIYRKPNQLYFGSDELRFYFVGNDSRGFVNLGEYPPSAPELFKELGVMDCIRVKKRKPDYEGHVVFAKYPPWHKRGRNGFDPTIHVDGLEHAIKNSNLKKSNFIWKKIARPYAVSIKGVIEKATWKNFENSGGPVPMTSSFGELLINLAWLPNSDGKMHRPCELTLDDLPESFERDAKLAEQLGMQKVEEAKLAEKVGIPVEWIEVLKDAPREVVNSPGTLEKIKELVWGEDLVEGDETNLQSGNPEFPKRPVKNPERRAAKFGEELENAPAKEYEERIRSVRANAPREAARVRLKDYYTNYHEQMICQICQKEMPFKKRDGEYYFQAVEALNKENFTKELEAQFLALCPECAARYQEFIKRDEIAMQEVIDRLMASTDFQVQLQLGELETNLHFVEKHWRDIKQVLESAKI